MQRVRQAMSYVKSSLCMFGSCYVRKPYALCPQETVKLRKKKQGKRRMIGGFYQNLSYFKAETTLWGRTLPRSECLFQVPAVMGQHSELLRGLARDSCFWHKTAVLGNRMWLRGENKASSFLRIDNFLFCSWGCRAHGCGGGIPECCFSSFAPLLFSHLNFLNFPVSTLKPSQLQHSALGWKLI